MSTLTATFTLERFTYADGAFVVAGTWHAEDSAPIGRARLTVDLGERTRRISARPAAPIVAGPDGVSWRGRFPCTTPPAEGAAATLEAGDTITVDLPAPQIGAGKATAKQQDELTRLREQVAALIEENAALRARFQAPMPRRAEIHASLRRPREPRGVLDVGGEPERSYALALAITGALGLFLVILLAWIL